MRKSKLFLENKPYAILRGTGLNITQDTHRETLHREWDRTRCPEE